MGIFDRMKKQKHKTIINHKTKNMQPNNQKNTPQDILDLAQATRQSYAEAERLTQTLQMEARAIVDAVSAISKLSAANASLNEQAAYLNKTLGISQDQFAKITQAQNNLSKAHNDSGESGKNFFGIMTKGLGGLSASYLGATIAVQQLASSGKGAYDLLIGQNIELQEQLLATQASLASTNKIISGGTEIKDPTTAIKALTEPVNEAIASIRKGSLELVGVTSSDIIPLFQNIAGKSASIRASLEQAADLALSFGAAAQTLKIPLDQTNNEMRLILESQISSDNRLAMSLNLNNEMVNRWKAQGVFVGELNKKLEAFRAGNALAAQSVGGVSSNILELVQEIGRVAGEPFLEPLVKDLNLVYNYLKDNKEQIIDFVSGVTQFFLEIGGEIGEIFKTLQPTIENLAAAIGNNLNNGLQIGQDILRLMVETLGALVKVAEPVLEVVSGIIKSFSEFSGSPFGKIVIETGLLLAGLQMALPALIGLGMGFVNIVSSVLIASEAISGAYVAIGGFQAVINTLALGGIPALQSAIAAAIPGLGAFAVSAAAALAPLLPIIALGFAIAFTLELKTIGDLNQGNEELEEYRKQIEQQGQQSLELAAKMKKVADARKINGSLTKEEEELSKKLESQQKNEIASINDKIKSIKELANLSPEQEATRKQEIEDLERQIKLLQKYSEGVKLQNKDLPELGNSFQQLANKINEATNKFKNPASVQEFKQASEDLIKYTQEQLKSGQITQAEAEVRLSQVRDNAKVSVDVQKSANDAIIKSREEALNYQVELGKIAQEKLKAQIDDEVLGNFEGNQKILEAKEDQLEKEIEATKKAIEAEDALRNKQVAEELAKIDLQITASQNKLNAITGNSADSQQKQRLEKANLDRLNVQKDAAQSSLNIESEQGIKLKSQLQTQETELSSTKSQARKARREEELKEVDEQQKLLDEKNSKRQITELDYAKQSLELTKSRGNAELTQLEEQASKLGEGNEKAKLAIAAKEAEIRAKIANSEQKFLEEQSKHRVALVDAEIKELEAKNSQRLITETDFNSQSLALTIKRTDAELAEINRQKARTLPSDKQRLEELAGQEADILKKRADAREKFEVEKSKLRLNIIDAEQKQAAAKLALGLVSQADFNQESLDLAIKHTDAELAEIQRQKARTLPADKQRLEELAGQEAEVLKKRADARASFEDGQIKIIEHNQAKALSVVSESEAKRLITVAELSSKFLIRKEEIEQKTLDITGKRLVEEYNLEKDKLDKLSALPPYTDPEKERVRQAEIDASRLKGLNLTKSILDNEKAQREALFAAIQAELQRQIDSIHNVNLATQTQIDKQKELKTVLSQSLQIEEQILQSKQSLITSTASLYKNELDILKETSIVEYEKKQIAETAALINLKNAKAQAVIEQQILDFKKQERDIALEMEKLNLKGKLADAQAGTAEAVANQKIAENDPNATRQQKEAASLKLQAAIQKEVAANFESSLID